MLTSLKIHGAVETYRKKFAEMKIGKVSLPESDKGFRIVGREHQLARCHRVLDEIIEHLAHGRLTPASQWLGFVQGVLWHENIYTWEEIERHGMPALV